MHKISTLLTALALPLLLLLGARTTAQELTEEARWLQEYLRLDTTNPPGGEHLSAAFLSKILHREGISYRLLVTPEGRTNLYARLPATERVGEKGALLLLHHMDVVPAEGEWRHPPFSGALVDGVLWGRGAVDAKSLGIAQLAAFLDVHRSGVPRHRDLIYLAVADEENGGGRGTAWLLEEHSELFADVSAVLNEGGGNRTVNGRTVWWGIEVDQKRPLWLRLVSRGRGGHASGFNPGSAAHDLISALQRLLELPVHYRIMPSVRRYLAAIAPLHNPRIQEAFLHLDRHVTPDGIEGPFPPGMSGFFVDTVQVTTLQGSARINSVAAEAVAQVDIRLLPDTDADAFLKRIREALGPEVEAEVLLRFPQTRSSPVDHEVFRAVQAVFEEEGQGPAVPVFIAGFTDSRFFRRQGIAAFGVSPFALEPQGLLGIHSSNENISINEFINGIERMKRIIRALAT